MAEGVRVERVAQPTDEDSELIRAGLVAYNRSVLGPTEHYPVVFHIRGPEGEFLGGLTGDVWLNQLNIDFIWLDESLRGQGHGARLLEEAERYAVERGATVAILDTSDFQVRPRYYERRGYEVFGVVGEPPERQSFYMRKRLAPPSRG